MRKRRREGGRQLARTLVGALCKGRRGSRIPLNCGSHFCSLKAAEGVRKYAATQEEDLKKCREAKSNEFVEKGVVEVYTNVRYKRKSMNDADYLILSDDAFDIINGCGLLRSNSH